MPLHRFRSGRAETNSTKETTGATPIGDRAGRVVVKTRTWYLSETGFPLDSYCVPGNEMTEAQKNEAFHILN